MKAFNPARVLVDAAAAIAVAPAVAQDGQDATFFGH